MLASLRGPLEADEGGSPGDTRLEVEGGLLAKDVGLVA